MGTVAQKIAYLNETKELIKESLNTNFNSQIEDTDTFRSYVSKISDLYINWPKVEGEGTNLTLNNTRKGKMSTMLKGNLSQKTNIITYTCLGTETGDYYFVYDSINYQFTMPTISANDVLVFNVDTLKLYLDTIEISTTTASTGTLITMNTTPNPDYPQDVEVVSGSNTIVVEGKNLCPIDNSNFTATSTWSSLNGSNANTYTNGTKVHLTAGTYTIKFSDYSNLDAMQVFAGGYTVVSTITGTFTLDTEGDIYIRVKAGNNTSPIKFKTQLEKGSTATTFEPYQSQNHPINLGTMELCKIGDYQDIIKKSTGKNLFSSQMELGTIDNATGLNTNNTNSIRSVDYIPVKPNTTYTLSNLLNYNCLIHEYAEDKTYIQYDGNYSSPRTFTTTANTYYIRVRSSVGSIQNDLAGKYMLNLGSTALPYEPYGKGKWYKHSEIGKVVLDGTENWYKVTNTSGNYIFFYSTALDNLAKKYLANNMYCDKLKVLNGQLKYNTSVSIDMINISNNDSSEILRVLLLNTRLNSYSVAYFKSWLSNNNVTAYYVLATPTNTEITDQTLIAQLDSFEKAKSYNSQTNISQENNDLPFIINATALMGNSD